MASYKLAPDAITDLEGIDDYSLEAWGPAKRDEYVIGLFELFGELATFPSMGTQRPEIAPLVRSRVYRREHVVFYEVHDEQCYVLRILHHTRDVPAAFVGNALGKR